MERTRPSSRMVIEGETEKLKKFRDSARPEEKVIFEDSLNQGKLYASATSALASPVKKMPLILSIPFAHRKELSELERRPE